MDQIYEEEIMAEDEPRSIFWPVSFVFQLLASYGWYLVGAAVASVYAAHKLRPVYQRWREAKEDAEYHKDPDKALAQMEAIQRAREKQQQMLLEASQRQAEIQKQREEKKREENLQRLQKYGVDSGRKLSEDGYMPLSGGASTSSYRAPKRSACGGGGCGR